MFLGCRYDVRCKVAGVASACRNLATVRAAKGSGAVSGFREVGFGREFDERRTDEALTRLAVTAVNLAAGRRLPEGPDGAPHPERPLIASLCSVLLPDGEKREVAVNHPDKLARAS